MSITWLAHGFQSLLQHSSRRAYWAQAGSAGWALVSHVLVGGLHHQYALILGFRHAQTLIERQNFENTR
jgi:hypothetical protein